MNDLTTEEMLSLFTHPSVWAEVVPVLNSMVALHRIMVHDDVESLNALEGLGEAAAGWDAAAACAALVNAVVKARGQGDVG